MQEQHNTSLPENAYRELKAGEQYEPVIYPRTFTSVQDEAILDVTDDAGKRLVDPAYTDTALENIHANEHVHYLLSCLSAKQKDIILATVIGHETLDAYRKRNGIAFTVAFLRQKAALKKMHHLLQTE